MSFLARFRILTKILTIVILLSGIATTITWLGVNSLKSLSDATDTMELLGNQSNISQKLAVNLLAINRAEFQLSTDPRPEAKRSIRETVEAETKLFLERFKWFREKANRPEIKNRLAELESDWLGYQKELAGTFSAADAVSNFQMSAEMDRLRKEAISSSDLANKVRDSLHTLSEGLENDVARVSAEATNEYLWISKVMIVVASIGISLGLLIGFLVGQYGVAKPIRAIVELLRVLANGDFSAEVLGTDRKDEVGEIAKAAVVFKDNGLAKTRMEHEQKETEKRTIEQRKTDMIKLADDFEGAVGEIIGTVSSASTELEASAGTLTKTAKRAQEVTTTVAAASEEASTNVQSVASASEELTSSVNEISRQVQQSARMAKEAVDQARTTNSQVGELSKAAARIGDVVELINTIAGQTNLLALNATIEAARAGEAGRGFAVVASEVKALAEQTAKATGEISQQISGIQAATHESVNAIKEISGTIEKLSEISASIASAVEEQGAATQEISRNVQQAAQGTQQVSFNIVDVQRGAGETGSASSLVLSAAQSLSRDSDRLKLEVGKFLNTVRAA
jgi:methyl-accepting chemotaxis protein